MKSAKTWWLIAIVAIIGAVAGVLAGQWSRTPAKPGPESGDAVAQLLATPFSSPGGETRSLANRQGKVLVVNFWATWCPPCREEMPEFSQAQDQYRPSGVEFAGIAIDDAANVVEFSKKTPVTYPLLLGPAELPGLMAKLGNHQQVLPFTIIIGRDGKLKSSHLGRLTKDDLAKTLAPLL